MSYGTASSVGVVVDSDYCDNYSNHMISPVSRHRDARFDLAELCTTAAELLGSVGPEDQRVRAVPDARTVRYYQSIGLVDRPEREGRDAVYRWRHLLQVVAVKRLQAQGEPLARIQSALLGVPTDVLEAALDMPSERPEALAIGTDAVLSEPAFNFVTRELAPGVLVVIDPRRVRDAEFVVQTLSHALSRTPRGGFL